MQDGGPRSSSRSVASNLSGGILWFLADITTVFMGIISWFIKQLVTGPHPVEVSWEIIEPNVRFPISHRADHFSIVR
jgi:hypothetical protein